MTTDCDSQPRGLFIHQAALGDFIVASRLIPFCDRHGGPHRWSYLGKPALGRLGKSLGMFEEEADFDAADWSLLFAPDVEPSARIKGFLRRFDLLLNVLCGPQTPFAKRLEQFAVGKVYHVDPKLPADFAGHLFDHLAGQLNFGPVDELPATPLPVDPLLREHVRRELIADGLDPSRLVLLHPGASSSAKCWPMVHFITLAREIAARGDQPGFVLGEVERERFPQADWGKLRSAGRIFADWPLPRLSALLTLSKRYIGNDNGISHLAATVGADTTVIFLHDNAHHWRPLGPRVTIRRMDSKQGSSLPELFLSA